jgi:alanine racemase
MKLGRTVVLIKKEKKGESVSYGRTWIAPEDTCIAVLPVGYADGLPRLASGKWQAVIGGKTYPLAGRICMDQCMAVLGSETNVRRWDEAVICGGMGQDAAALARTVGTIPYEITCNINKRVPRVYEE